MGRLRRGGPLGPGLFFTIPCMDDFNVVDLRTVSVDIAPQEILTKDSVTVAVDAAIYYKVVDPMAAVCKVENHVESTKLLASTTLRTVLGTKTMAEILTDREHLAAEISLLLDQATDPWGIKVKILIRTCTLWASKFM